MRLYRPSRARAGSPRSIDVGAVRDALLTIPGVADVHNLRVWSLTPGRAVLAAHIGVHADRVGSPAITEILRAAETDLCNRFDIHDVTLQVEPRSGLLHCPYRRPAQRYSLPEDGELLVISSDTHAESDPIANGLSV